MDAHGASVAHGRYRSPDTVAPTVSSTGRVHIATGDADAGALANFAPAAPLHDDLFYGSAEWREFGLTDFR